MSFLTLKEVDLFGPTWFCLIIGPLLVDNPFYNHLHGLVGLLSQAVFFWEVCSALLVYNHVYHVKVPHNLVDEMASVTFDKFNGERHSSTRSWKWCCHEVLLFPPT